MRAVTAPEQTVLQSKARKEPLRIDVENSSGAYVDLTSYLGKDWTVGATVEVDVDRPVFDVRVQLVRASGSDKLSPLISPAALDLGRGIKVYGSTAAPGGAANWKLIGHGEIDEIDVASDPMEIVARGLRGSHLADRWIEQETVYGSEAGVPIEDVISAIVTDHAGETINTTSPGFLISPAYEQEKEPVLDASNTLAGLIGWTIREKFNASSGDFEPYFLEPDRAITTEQWTFGPDDYFQPERLSLDRTYVRNVITVSYRDAATGERATYTAEDAASIAAYGRRWMELEQADDSPIDSAAEAQTLADNALLDLKEPSALYEVPVRFFWPVELDDYYAFTAAPDLFGSTQKWAVTGYTHEFPAGGGMPVTRLRVRGKPQGHYRDWHRREKKGAGEGELEDVARLALSNFREIRRDDSSVTFGWEPGSDVDHVWVYTNTVVQPTTGDPWPQDSLADADDVIDAATVEYTVPIPPPGYLLYAQFEPSDASGLVRGPVRRAIVQPLADEPDRLISLVLLVNDADGSVAGRVEAGHLAQSFRLAYAVGNDPAWPSTAAVEAGTVYAIASVATFTLPPGTVPLGQRIRARAAGYLIADGTGTDGVTDHGQVIGAEDDRTKFRVPKLEITSEVESAGTGTVTVKVHDPDDLATNLYARIKSGADAWGAWTLVQADPADQSTHQRQVTLKEKHQSFVQFRLDYTLGGTPGADHVTSGGLDLGNVPDGSVHPVIDEATGILSAVLVGDVDTAKWKVFASLVEADITPANVDGQVAIVGRVLKTADVGTLLTLELGERGYIGARALSADDKASSAIIRGEAVFREVAPTLKVTTETEGATLGTFGVTVDDPGAQADALEYRTKAGDADWSAWADAVGGGAPPNDGVEYSQQVALVEKHLSFVEFRLTFTLAGETQVIHAKSSGFDLGKRPDISFQIYLDEAARTASAIVIGDSDTAKAKVFLKVGSAVTPAEVRAQTAVVGRVLLPDDFGNLLTALLEGQLIYGGAFGYGPSDEESSEMAEAKVVFGPALPTLEPTTITESGTTFTFGVTLKDEGGRSVALYYKKRVGAAAWPTSWTLKASSPTNGTEYLESEQMVEKHFTEIMFRLVYEYGGRSREVIALSPGGDLGTVPNVMSVVEFLENTFDVRAVVRVDSDTESIKIAASTTGEPSLTTIRAATALNRPSGEYVYQPEDIGTLLTAAGGYDVFIGVLPYSAAAAGGTEGPVFRHKFRVPYPPAIFPTVSQFDTQVSIRAQAFRFRGTPPFQFNDAVVAFRERGATHLGSGSITAATNTLTVTGAQFRQQDVKKAIRVAGAGAGGAELQTRIATVISATQVTLAVNASTTVAGADVSYGNFFSRDFDADGSDGFDETNTRNRPLAGEQPSWIEFRAEVASGGADVSQLHRVEIPPKVTPDLQDASFSVDASSGTAVYQFGWAVNEGITDADHDVQVRGGVEGEAAEVSSTEVSPKTNVTENVNGGAHTIGDHYWGEIILKTSGGAVLKKISFSQIPAFE